VDFLAKAPLGADTKAVPTSNIQIINSGSIEGRPIAL
jgi:hypothetical protein